MLPFLVTIAPTPIGNIRGIGPLGFDETTGKTPADAAELFQTVLSNIVGVMSASAIIWFVFQFIVGAIGWISAGGYSKAIEEASERIMNAVSGIIIVLSSIVLISLLGFLLGIDILNIQQFITGITDNLNK